MCAMARSRTKGGQRQHQPMCPPDYQLCSVKRLLLLISVQSCRYVPSVGVRHAAGGDENAGADDVADAHAGQRKPPKSAPEGPQVNLTSSVAGYRHCVCAS